MKLYPYMIFLMFSLAKMIDKELIPMLLKKINFSLSTV